MPSAPSPSASGSAAPAPWTIDATDRDGAGFVGAEVLGAALGREIERAQALQDACTVLYLRLDQHADISARLGAERLAAVEYEIASLINDFLKEGTDIPGRWKEGLVIVLPKTASRIACNLAEQIRFTVSHLSFPDVNGNSTMSIGVAAYPEHAATAHELLECAAGASQQAEAEGGNAIKVHGT